MEDVPPSYDRINSSVLELLPPYLTTACLVALCQVSHTYYGTFIPYLWGSPAAHFVQISGESGTTSNPLANNGQITGSHNDLVYVALTWFRRSLRKARLKTRLLCHTFHLPPALSEIYGGPNAVWLRELLDWLPGLQSLCVSGLPFFDHHSLIAVHKDKTSHVPVAYESDHERVYSVKLLLAAKEPNSTSSGLSLLMVRLPQLVYLDLSYTTPARDTSVLSGLHHLKDIRVLKLRGIGLRDGEIDVLAKAIGLKVRLLDISENQITDHGIDSLVSTCFATSIQGPQTPTLNLVSDIDRSRYRRHHESWPVGIAPPSDFMSLDTIRTVELDNALVSQLTNPLTGRLAFEDIPHGGITHLYHSGNTGITMEGLRCVLNTGRVHVLDAGDIAIPERSLIGPTDDQRYRSGSQSDRNRLQRLITRRRAPSSPTTPRLKTGDSQSTSIDEDFDERATSDMGVLTRILREKASASLTYLRVHHALITSQTTQSDRTGTEGGSPTNRNELPGSVLLAAELSDTSRSIAEVSASTSLAVEAPVSGAIFEVDATPSMRVELPGDPIHIAISPPVGESPMRREEVASIDEITSPIKGEGAYAPEVVADDGKEMIDPEAESVTLDASGTGVLATKQISQINSNAAINAVAHNGSTTDAAIPLNTRRRNEAYRRKLSETTSARLVQLEYLISRRHKTRSFNLHPGMLPNLVTLVLTNIPSQVSETDASIIDGIRTFIESCADEARIARLKVKTDYSLPPGRARQNAEAREVRKLFALRTIVLEIVEPETPDRQRRWNKSVARTNPFKSSTGDMDSENLWTASQDDFSFFDEQGEQPDECGVYDNEPDKHFPTAVSDDKMVVTDQMQGTYSADTQYHGNALSPVSAVTSTYGSSTSFTPVTPYTNSHLRTPLSGPRDLPLGRPRRVSNETPHHTLSHRHDSHTSQLPPSIPQVVPPSPSTSTYTPAAQYPRLTSSTIRPARHSKHNEATIDVKAALSTYRKSRKQAYLTEVQHQLNMNANSSSQLTERDLDVYVPGYWPGEVKVSSVSNASVSARSGTTGRNMGVGKGERTGKVDIYGNYFEGGYLYP